MKIVVTGGRDYADQNMLEDVLDILNPTEIFMGDATGADTLAREYCDDRGTLYTVFEADWDKHGKAAGPIRNRDMLVSAGPTAMVIAFPGGKGTENCIKTAVGFNMIVLRVEK